MLMCTASVSIICPNKKMEAGMYQAAIKAMIRQPAGYVTFWGKPKVNLRKWRSSSHSPPLQDMSNGKKPNVPCDHAFVYKITPRPTWIEP